VVGIGYYQVVGIGYYQVVGIGYYQVVGKKCLIIVKVLNIKSCKGKRIRKLEFEASIKKI